MTKRDAQPQPLESGLSPACAATASLLAQSRGTEEFLRRVLALFSETYKSDRCMLFLYNDVTRQLTLKVSIGYPQSDKASIVLKLGEGLSGRLLAERRLIYTEMASDMRGYVRHYNFPDTGYQTFLGIPILQGRMRVGVIAMWRPTGVPFLAEEISSAGQTAADLAPAIQNAAALLSIESASNDAEIVSKPFVVEGELALRGIPVSNGWGIGSVHVFTRNPAIKSVFGSLQENSSKPAVRSIDEAVAIVRKNINEQTRVLSEKLPEAVSLIFESFLMILNDENYIGKIKSLIDSGTDTVSAITSVSNEFIKLFRNSTNKYLVEKAYDVEDLAEQLVSAATEVSPEQSKLSRPHIVIAEKLLPSDVLRIAQGSAEGIVLMDGGITAHVSLLVRSMHIPMMIVSDRRLLKIPESQTAILDCANELIYINPTPERYEEFAMRRTAQETDQIQVPADSSPARTLDGVRIRLNANINLIADIRLAHESYADGIGLYRTEFPFLMRSNLPSETEQKMIYARLLSEMRDKPVIFRTLDAGGDKIMPYLFKGKENNPAMGLRSMRFTLRHPDVLEQQMRSIIRAVQDVGHKNTAVMFPMISSIMEFKDALNHFNASVDSVRAEFESEDIIIPGIGVMIEIPAVIAVLDGLAKYVDFFSIGTNDLIQYTLGVDRTNDKVSSYYIPHHPSILKCIKLIADAGMRNNIPVSVCGEMARDPKYMPFFIGVGIHSFSLDPTQIPNARELVSKFCLDQCRKYAENLLSISVVSEIEAIMDGFTEQVFR